MNKNIYIGALSFNRSKEFTQSIMSIIRSLEYLKTNDNIKIKIFDDCSKNTEFKKIKNFCLNHNKNSKNKIELIKNKKNLGYGLNYINAVKWFISFNDKNSIFYLHETDLIIEKKWFKKVLKLLEVKNDLVISPVHHINHLNYSWHAKGMYKLFINEIGIKKVHNNNLTEELMVKKEGKIIFKNKDFVAKLSYGLVGARVADYLYWNQVNKKKEFILKHKDKEDMALSFIGKNKCTYLVPGSANIAFRKGLHGYMFLNVASFDYYFYKFSFILKIRRLIILIILKLLKIFNIKKFLEKFFKY